MKAVVWTDINTIEIQEVPIPKPGQQQVLIQVKGAGVCSTDLHIMAGHLELAKTPHILGHEIAGIIVETGDGVDPSLVGQRVVADTIVSCGTCKFCRRGQYELCLHGGEVGYPPYNGGYAEYVVVPAVGIHQLPAEISFEEGAIIESIICPAGSLFKHGVIMGETVFIQGSGVAGLAYLQVAKACGAGKVIVSASGVRKAKARELGADVVIDARSEDVYARVLEETKGYGADLSIEAAGAVASIDLAVRCVRSGGRVILYGIPSKEDIVPFPVLDIIVRQLQIFGACSNPFVWDPLIELVRQGRVNVKSLVTHTFPIDRFQEALSTASQRKDGAIKCVITF